MKISKLAEQEPETATEQRETLRVVDGYYEVESDGYQVQQPVLHYTGRTVDGERAHVAVDDFNPYFLVRSYELTSNKQLLEQLRNDNRVRSISLAERIALDDGAELARIETVCPWHVRELREPLHEDGFETFEADVLFPQRLLIDTGVTDFMSVPADRSGPISYETIEPADPDDADPPRVATIDIEVDASNGFPEPDEARQTVFSVVAHDSYTDEYIVWVLPNTTREWADIGATPRGDTAEDGFDGTEEVGAHLGEHTDPAVDDVTVTACASEWELLQRLINWLTDRSFDVWTGWNFDSFDAPYIINRCFEIELWDIQAVSPTESVSRHDDGGVFVNSDIGGVHIFDMMDAYKKSQYSALKSDALSYVSAKELDREKLDVDEQAAWHDDPVSLVEYNIRDVSAVVALNEQMNLL